MILHVGRRRCFDVLDRYVGLVGFLLLKGVAVGLVGWLVGRFLGYSVILCALSV